MAPQKPPKVVLFDIGGVCVLSPMQGILDYERKYQIPESWINYAIRYSSPNGHWQRLERGEIKLDADFFTGFTADLHNKSAWRDFNANFPNEKKKLKDLANPTRLGDPTSLKAETADSSPTEQDRGSSTTSHSSSPSSSSSSTSKSHSQDNSGKPTLSKLAKDTTIGDPVSLESEEVVISSQSSENQASTRNNHSNIQSHPPPSSSSSPNPNENPPPINTSSLFTTMMAPSRNLDPHIFPFLQHLRSQSPRPILAALSNTIIFPPDHPYGKEPQQYSFPTPDPDPDPSSNKASAGSGNVVEFNPAKFFDVYISSAEVGMRKPDREIYDLTIRKLNEFAATTTTPTPPPTSLNGKDPKTMATGTDRKIIKPEDIIFLDDIGENLRMARDVVGMRTIRVRLGQTGRAVRELEGVLAGKEVVNGEEKMGGSKL